MIGLLASTLRHEWTRRHAVPADIRVSFDRAIGNPGYAIWVENRSAVAIKATAWGVMNASDAPRSAKRRRTLASVSLDPKIYPAISLWASGPERVEALDRQLIHVGLDGKLNPRLSPDDGLVAWVQVESVGVAFSAQKSSDWARSDYKPRGCKQCRHDEHRHEAHVLPRKRFGLRTGTTRKHLRCRVPGCSCRRFRFDPHLKPSDVIWAGWVFHSRTETRGSIDDVPRSRSQGL